MKNIVSLILVLLSSGIFAQSIKVKFSGELKGTPMDNPKGFFKTSEGDIYFGRATYSISKELNYLYKISKNLKIGKKKKIAPQSKSTYSSSIIEIDGKILWFTIKKIKKKRILERQILEVNPKSGIRKLKSIGTLDYNKYKDFPVEEIRFSPDSSKILVLDVFDEDSKKDNCRINFVVLDRSLNVIMEKAYDYKVSQKKVDIQKVIISNEGEIYWLSRIYNSNKRKEFNRKTKKPDYVRMISSYSKEGNLKSKKIKLNNLTLTGALLLDKVGNLYTVLPYKNKKSVFPEGLYIYKFSGSTLSLLKNNKRGFTKQEVNMFGDWKSKEKKYINFYHFNNNWIVSKEGISCYMDKNYMRSEQTGNGFANFFYSKAGIEFKIDTNASLTQTTFIPKAIVRGDYLTDGTIYLDVSNKNYFLYNETKKNLDRPISEYKKFKSKKYFKSEITVLAYKDDKGNLIRKKIDAGKGFLLGTDYSLKISKNKFMFYFVKFTTFGMKYKFAILTINP